MTLREASAYAIIRQLAEQAEQMQDQIIDLQGRSDYAYAELQRVQAEAVKKYDHLKGLFSKRGDEIKALKLELEDYSINHNKACSANDQARVRIRELEAEVERWKKMYEVSQEHLHGGPQARGSRS